jgi:hypothetical protein
MKQVAKPAPNAKESQQGDLSAALTAGDITPPCILRSLDDKTVDIRVDAIAGNPLVLLFAASISAPPSRSPAEPTGTTVEFLSSRKGIDNSPGPALWLRS